MPDAFLVGYTEEQVNGSKIGLMDSQKIQNNDARREKGQRNGS